MDEYERASEELKDVLKTIDKENYIAISDHETKDPDCVSIQSIMAHVVGAGYGYANYIRTQFGEALGETKKNFQTETSEEACREIDFMLKYNIETLQNKFDMTEDDVMKNIMKVRWGPNYDIEQLLEHAIVHILRHRRQIEKFLNK
ncbi:MAG: DinB family protein [Bacteroidota bacterium]|nr:DinB family protein [Bacteroidota bacterium]